MIVPIQVGDSWYLVRNLRRIQGDGIRGTRSRFSGRSRLDGDYWTGTRWEHQRCFGLRLNSREEAEEYRDQNFGRM